MKDVLKRTISDAKKSVSKVIHLYLNTDLLLVTSILYEVGMGSLSRTGKWLYLLYKYGGLSRQL